MIQGIISKKRALVILLFSSLFYSIPVLAVPVPTTPFVIEQPDGGKFMARRWGDEFQSGYEDTDGYSIIQNEETGVWYYAATDKVTGELIATKQRADKEVPERISYSSKGGSAIETISQKFPHFEEKVQKIIDVERAVFEKNLILEKLVPSGRFNLPVVLVDFRPPTGLQTISDVNTPRELVALVRRLDSYMNEASFGKFRVSTGANGIMKVTLNRPKTFYARDTFRNGRPFLQDINKKIFYQDISTQLQRNGVNLSSYDNDNDGNVDELVIVAAGVDSASSVPISQAHYNQRFHSSNTRNYGSQKVGVKNVNNRLIISEFANTRRGRTQVGVFAHELLHTFGAPDLYDYQSNGSRSRIVSNNDAGIGDWGVMGSGNWLPNGTGTRPVHPSVYVKQKLGWIIPERKVTHGQGTANKAINLLLSAFSGRRPGNTYKCSAQNNSKEYFLMENRTRTGFDRSLPGEGMLIWHIDESEDDNDSGRKGRRRLVTLEEADGNSNLQQVGAGSRNPPRNSNLGDASDPFPGSRLVNSFNLVTIPNSRFYDFKDSGFYLKNITQNARKQVATNYSCKSFDIVWLLPLVLLVVFRRYGFTN